MDCRCFHHCSPAESNQSASCLGFSDAGKRSEQVNTREYFRLDLWRCCCEGSRCPHRVYPQSTQGWNERPGMNVLFKKETRVRMLKHKSSTALQAENIIKLFQDRSRKISMFLELKIKGVAGLICVSQDFTCWNKNSCCYNIKIANWSAWWKRPDNSNFSCTQSKYMNVFPGKH